MQMSQLSDQVLFCLLVGSSDTMIRAHIGSCNLGIHDGFVPQERLAAIGAAHRADERTF
jgi:hypothetical protein